MRKLVAGLAIGGSLTLGAVATLLTVDSESPAAPPTVSCPPFSGSGPIPGCSLRVDGTHLQITLYNNATRSPAVECTLTPSGALRPTDSASMGPGSRGTLGASVFPSVSRVFVVDCRGGGTGADRVERQTTISARTEAPVPERTTPPARRSSPPPAPSAPSTSRESDVPADDSAPQPSTGDAGSAEAAIPPPTVTTTTTTVPASS
ncbi:hypothetical protein GTC6_22412 [Gordonia terrae C-6]|uniref:Uncharacterized protein n=1 Tax=Gordonia terrae C-6 TaxID=1316928 RepID=R7Y366_9ACTN|nr:hypothetical protein [Gordonia terrae]EON30478.1 hypothetical protein GTC6_22412 [Gordonia terrae C-6]